MFGWATIEATMIAGEGYKIQKTHINNVTIPLVKYDKIIFIQYSQGAPEP